MKHYDYYMRILIIICICVISISIYMKYDKMEYKENNNKEENKINNIQQDTTNNIEFNIPTIIKSSFECYTLITKQANIKQRDSNNSKTIFQIKKGQKICLNFPQDILNSNLQITLKDIMGKWVIITIMNDEILLRGYLPIDTLRNKNNQIPNNTHIKDSINNAKTISLKIPKIKSYNIPNIHGTIEIKNIIKIIESALKKDDIEEARKWLALAQDINPNEIDIYKLYIILLNKEGNQEEANKLSNEINKYERLKNK